MQLEGRNAVGFAEGERSSTSHETERKAPTPDHPMWWLEFGDVDGGLLMVPISVPTLPIRATEVHAGDR